MNKTKRLRRGIEAGILSLVLLWMLVMLFSGVSDNLLLVSCTDPEAAQLIGKLDFAEAVYRFQEEKSEMLSTSWRSMATPVTWVCGDFASCDGKLLCGRWPESNEKGAVVLSKAQASSLFGTMDCLGRAVSVSGVEGTVVGVYQPKQSLPVTLSQIEGAPAYVMTEGKQDALLAVRLVDGYDDLLAVSEVKQQLIGNGIYDVQIENLALTAAQTKGHIQMMIAVILGLYLGLIWQRLKKQRKKFQDRILSAFRENYMPAALRKAGIPLLWWLLVSLLPLLGMVACVWMFFSGIVVDPQLLPRTMTGAAIWDAIKSALANLNSHRLPNAACCNTLLWTQRLSKLCFAAMLLLYLPWWKEIGRHAEK